MSLFAIGFDELKDGPLFCPITGSCTYNRRRTGSCGRTGTEGKIKSLKEFDEIRVDRLWVLEKFPVQAFDVAGVRVGDVGKILHGIAGLEGSAFGRQAF